MINDPRRQTTRRSSRGPDAVTSDRRRQLRARGGEGDGGRKVVAGRQALAQREMKQATAKVGDFSLVKTRRAPAMVAPHRRLVWRWQRPGRERGHIFFSNSGPGSGVISSV
jgi:hypothetical protein